MNKIIIAVLLAAATLTGCGSSSSDSDASVEEKFSFTEDEKFYADYLREEYPVDFSPLSDQIIMRNGNMMCDMFEQGTTFEEMLEQAVDSGYSVDVASGYIGITAEALCPELGIV